MNSYDHGKKNGEIILSVMLNFPWTMNVGRFELMLIEGREMWAKQMFAFYREQ